MPSLNLHPPSQRGAEQGYGAAAAAAGFRSAYGEGAAGGPGPNPGMGFAASGMLPPGAVAAAAAGADGALGTNKNPVVMTFVSAGLQASSWGKGAGVAAVMAALGSCWNAAGWGGKRDGHLHALDDKAPAASALNLDLASGLTSRTPHTCTSPYYAPQAEPSFSSQLWRTLRTIGGVFVMVTCLGTILDDKVGLEGSCGLAVTLWAGHACAIHWISGWLWRNGFDARARAVR